MARLLSVIDGVIQKEVIYKAQDPLPTSSITDFYSYCYWSLMNRASKRMQQSLLTIAAKIIIDLGPNKVNSFSKKEIINFGRIHGEYDDTFDIDIAHFFKMWELIQKANVKPVICYYFNNNNFDSIRIRYGLVYRNADGLYMQPYFFDAEFAFVKCKREEKLLNFRKVNYVDSNGEFKNLLPEINLFERS